jgi:hypothetical protein
MEEEAEEINPPVSVERPFTKNVDEALSAPATWKPPLIEELALEINPPVKVERPLTSKVEEAFNAPAT